MPGIFICQAQKKAHFIKKIDRLTNSKMFKILILVMFFFSLTYLPGKSNGFYKTEFH
jgi:hypothetical protein